MQTLSIGEVAKKCGISVETLRFYERKSLIVPDSRSEGGYRQYSEQAIQRVNFIQHAKAVGFSLKEIADLLNLRESPNSTCADIKQRAMQKVEDIDLRIKALEEMRRALSDLSTRCQSSSDIGECPILEAFDRIIDDESSVGC